MDEVIACTSRAGIDASDWQRGANLAVRFHNRRNRALDDEPHCLDPPKGVIEILNLDR